MYICLSSGASARYRQDVLRAIAMPEGSRLQFRYDLKWIAHPIQCQLSAGDVSGTPCLIAYIDQHDKAKTPELVPCRFATLLKAEPHGTTASLIFALKEFVYAADLAAFNAEIRAATAGMLPNWQPNGTIQGAYWLQVEHEPNTIVKSLNLAEWEKVVTQLAARADFAGESFFYTIHGMYLVPVRTPVSQKDGVYHLAADKEYELRIYHFHPTSTPGGTRLSFASSSSQLTFTTNPRLIADSRYDLKRVRLKTLKPATAESVLLTIERSDSQQAPFNFEFDLSALISGLFWRTLVYGIALGLLLAGPNILAAFSNPSLPPSNRVAISVISGIAGLAAGILAAFGFKKFV